MIEPTLNDIGREVIYTPRDLPLGERDESGIITTISDLYVFVRYGADKHSKATSRADLRWASGAAS